MEGWQGAPRALLPPTLLHPCLSSIPARPCSHLGAVVRMVARMEAVGEEGQGAGDQEVLYLRGSGRKIGSQPQVQSAPHCSLHQ